MDTKCPVCETALGFTAWNGETASDEICHGCGIQFGYNDPRPDIGLGDCGEAGARRALEISEFEDLHRGIDFAYEVAL